MVELFANSGDPDQIPHSAATDLGALFVSYPIRGLQSSMGSIAVRKPSDHTAAF